MHWLSRPRVGTQSLPATVARLSQNLKWYIMFTWVIVELAGRWHVDCQAYWKSQYMSVYVHVYVCVLLQPSLGLFSISCWDQIQRTPWRVGNTKRVHPGPPVSEDPGPTDDRTGEAGEAAALHPFASYCWFSADVDSMQYDLWSLVSLSIFAGKMGRPSWGTLSKWSLPRRIGVLFSPSTPSSALSSSFSTVMEQERSKPIIPQKRGVL